MCTYQTVVDVLTASAKGPGGSWFSTDQVAVYYDHPAHAMAEHALCIDLTDTERGPGQRIALELSASAARRLVQLVNEALDAVPAELLAVTRG